MRFRQRPVPDSFTRFADIIRAKGHVPASDFADWYVVQPPQVQRHSTVAPARRQVIRHLMETLFGEEQLSKGEEIAIAQMSKQLDVRPDDLTMALRSFTKKRAHIPTTAFARWYATQPPEAQQRSTVAIMRRRVIAERTRQLGTQPLTERDERGLEALVQQLAVLPTELPRDYAARLAIARAKAGRLERLRTAALATRPGEFVHLQASARLVKMTTLTEYRGRSGGVSIKVAPGVRVRSGRSRGRSVEIGEALRDVDTGRIYVTSERTIFLGSKNTFEIPHSKLLRLRLAGSTVAFHGSGRSQPPTVRTDQAWLLEATVNAAAQIARGTRQPAEAASGVGRTETPAAGRPFRELEMPSRFTQRWIEDNLPGMSASEARLTIERLRERAWTDSDLAQRVYPHLAPAVRNEFGLK